MTEGRWPADWIRGVLELAVLAVLRDGPAHGYAIARRLEAAGLGTVKGGTLYPLLSRLEVDGFITTQWSGGDGGPGRKQITLSATGQAELVRRSEHWAAFTDVINDITGAERPRRP